MAQPQAPLPNETSDTMSPVRPFSRALLPLINATKLQPENPKSQRTHFYEQRCDECMDRLFDDRTLPQQKIKAALEIGGLIEKIEDPDLITNATYILREMMIDDSEQHSVRTVCAISLGSSGYKSLVEDMEKEVLKANTSIQSKLLALKALAIHRSDEAIEMLGMVAQYGDNDTLCMAASRELLGIPLSPAQKIVNGLLCSPPRALLQNPEFFAEFRRLADCILPVN